MTTKVRAHDISGYFPRGGSISRPIYKQVTYQGLKLTLANANTQWNQPHPRWEGLCAHWSAGAPLTVWDDYPVCLVNPPNTTNVLFFRTVPKGMKGQHLAGRNGAFDGVGFMALGPEHVNKYMIEGMAKYVAEWCIFFDREPFGAISIPDGYYVDGRGLVLTGARNTITTYTDHGIVAGLDNYGGYRWDIGGRLGPNDPRNLYALVGRKVEWYMNMHVKNTPHATPEARKKALEFYSILG